MALLLAAGVKAAHEGVCINCKLYIPAWKSPQLPKLPSVAPEPTPLWQPGQEAWEWPRALGWTARDPQHRGWTGLGTRWLLLYLPGTGAGPRSLIVG